MTIPPKPLWSIRNMRSVGSMKNKMRHVKITVLFSFHLTASNLCTVGKLSKSKILIIVYQI